MVKKKKDVIYYEAIGRRKSATSRVRLYLAVKGDTYLFGQKYKKGSMIINKKLITDYFKLNTHQKKYLLPFKLTNTEGRFVVSATIIGGGIEGQLEAFVLASSRALQIADASYRPTLKKAGLLTTDARVRERRKVGTGGKARRKKQSPKR